MTKTLATEITIDAPRARVWQILTDLPAFPEWNPFIVAADGRVETGERLTLRMQNVGAGVRTLRPAVIEVRDSERLRWRGRLWVPGLLDVEHTFELADRPAGGTLLVQKEDFRGALVPVVARTLDRGTLPAFVAMNEALKQRAEEPVGSPRG
jgi:hypothetical protein